METKREVVKRTSMSRSAARTIRLALGRDWPTRIFATYLSRGWIPRVGSAAAAVLHLRLGYSPVCTSSVTLASRVPNCATTSVRPGFSGETRPN